MHKSIVIYLLFFALSACCAVKPSAVKQSALKPVNASASKVGNGIPTIDATTAIYVLPIQEGVSYQDVLDSLKSVSVGMNFVNPASFPIAEHIKNRGIDPQGVKEVHSYCNLSLGTDIFLDHPEFLVFAPCRIALYEKPDANNKLKLFIALARPTFDLKSIKNPTARAVKAAQELEDKLIILMERASRGDI